MPQPDSANEILATLALTERCADAVSQALLRAEPDAIEAAARDLQQASRRLSGVLQGRFGKAAQSPGFTQRLGKLVQGMAMQREALLRRSAVVERALHSIVPATRAPTYGGAAPYGYNARQSGAFKLLSA